MKILVLQLARLGDIYQSWPALRALKRQYPHAEIDIMVRPRFAEAVDGLDVISKKIFLPVQDFLAPLVGFPQNLGHSLNLLGQFLAEQKAKKYDWIVNFSFSPVSSYLVHAIKGPETQVTGYTRHEDGYFNPEGEIAAYFYAQVGVYRHNRYHVTDLLAGMVGVELEDADWDLPKLPAHEFTLPPNYIVAHIGASESHKTLPAFKWSRIFKYFNILCPNIPVVIVGAAAEKGIAGGIVGSRGEIQIVDLVGKTKLQDLFSIIKGSQLLIGCDSAPMHIAGFTKTPCLNISLGSVRFWETGPRAPRSYVFSALSVEDFVAEFISNVMSDILKGIKPKGLAHVIPDSPCYQIEETVDHRFPWELIQAIYMGDPFPMAPDLKFLEGCQKLHEINEVILDQLEAIKKVGLEKVKAILDRSDEVIQALSDLVPLLRIYTTWLQAERARIPPGSVENSREATLKMHLALRFLLKAYILDETQNKEGGPRG